MLDSPERPDAARLPGAAPTKPPKASQRRQTQLAMVGALGVLVVAWLVWTVITPTDEGRAYAVQPLFEPDVLAPRTDPPADLLEGGPREIALRVAKSVEAMWEQTFRAAGEEYEGTTISFGDTSSCTGEDEDFIGYYCIEGVFLMDEKFDELEDDWGKDDARLMWAMVVAHEIGHHVQQLRGSSGAAAGLIEEIPDKEQDITVRVELQAECLAGVWAGSAGLDHADDQFGDDDTHGTAGQQRKWFRIGRDTRSPAACQTFVQGALR